MSSCKVLTGDAPSSVFGAVADAIISSKRVIVLTGAGISCSAGLPDFRSKDGLYQLVEQDQNASGQSKSPRKRSRGTLKGQELFSANVFRDPDHTSTFYSFIANLYSACQPDKIAPTPTHHFIAKLAKKGKLQRCYTQNIDSLEDAAGLSQVLQRTHKSTRRAKANKWAGDVVQLHGRLDLVKCGCGWEGHWTDEMLETMKTGTAPACPDCDALASERRRLHKRSVKQVGHYGNLKPSIVLYDDPCPPASAEQILQIEAYDLSKKIDLVLVMGTSLKVPGFKNLVRDFVHEARQKNPKRSIVSILVNATDVLTAEWKSVFDYFVMDESDAFVKRVVTCWKKRRPDDWLQQTALSHLTNTVKQVQPVAKSNVPKQTIFPPTPPKSATKNTNRAPILSPSTPPRKRQRLGESAQSPRRGESAQTSLPLSKWPEEVEMPVPVFQLYSPPPTPCTPSRPSPRSKRSRSVSLSASPAIYVRTRDRSGSILTCKKTR